MQGRCALPRIKVDGSWGLVFLIGPLDVIGMWLNEDQCANVMNTLV